MRHSGDINWLRETIKRGNGSIDIPVVNGNANVYDWSKLFADHKFDGPPNEVIDFGSFKVVKNSDGSLVLVDEDGNITGTKFNFDEMMKHIGVMVAGGNILPPTAQSIEDAKKKLLFEAEAVLKSLELPKHDEPGEGVDEQQPETQEK